ncbi:MAG TPA: GNAT family N-acetyltransferase [Longimicrobiaceae bacterium]|nr:GNAT family N-acetyltransferase [Longimicrobiaceae bacterium]
MMQEGASGEAVHVVILGIEEVVGLVPLLRAYLPATYGAEWMGSPDSLRRDLAAGRFRACAAVAGGKMVGFMGWTPSYDLHNCVWGGEGLDLYVEPGWRGRGTAVLLLCAACREIEVGGGAYLKGTAVGNGTGGRLYARVAVCHPDGCIISGRAFRRMAELAGRPVRELARLLPDRAWNFEG